MFRILSCFVFILIFFASNSSFAQWDWEEDKKAEKRVESTLPSYFYDAETLKKYIIADLDGLEYPHYQKDFAEEVSGLVDQLIDDSLLVYGWKDWEAILKEVTQEVAPYAEFNRDFTFVIVDDPATNAYATEGGLIMVNVGFLADIESIDELRLVLAHEIGHVHYHHPYLSYVEKRKVQSQQNASMLLGYALFGIAGAYIAHSLVTAPAVSNLYKHSRSQETAADEFALSYMNNEAHSVVDGARIYQMFHRDKEKYEYITGRSADGFYGSTHPDPLDRYDLLVNQANEKENASADATEEFLAIRHRARLRKLDLLIEGEAYRGVIDIGWHYLLKENNNLEIKQRILTALKELRDQGSVNYCLGRVLSDGYAIDDELKKQIAEADMSTDEVKEMVRSVLRMTDSKGGSPFPLNTTFGEMYEIIHSEIREEQKIEREFYFASKNQSWTDSSVQEYLDKGGKYSTYAKYLLNPLDFNLDKSVCIPIDMEIKSAVDYQYTSCFQTSNWDKLLKKMDVHHPDVNIETIENNVNIDSATVSELKTLSSLLSYHRGVNSLTIPMEHIHPSILNMACENGIGKFILFEYVETSYQAYIQVLEIDLKKGKCKQSLNFMRAKHVLTESYIPKRVWKTYKRSLKKPANQWDYY